jgi:hypothetical protein
MIGAILVGNHKYITSNKDHVFWQCLNRLARRDSFRCAGWDKQINRLRLAVGVITEQAVGALTDNYSKYEPQDTADQQPLNNKPGAVHSDSFAK